MKTETNQADNKEKKSNRRKGIYLLPNILTTAALFCGFYALLSGVNGHYVNAAMAIFIAMILDGLDGRVARMTNTQSDFGAEYDSLSDMIGFGLAPSILIYTWSLQSLGKEGFFAAFIYTTCAALRLARFNTQVGISDKKYFSGLPSPAAAAMIASTIWVSEKYGLNTQSLQYVMMVFTIIVGLLMASDLHYYSFKEFGFRDKVPFIVLVVIAIIFAVVYLKTAEVLFISFLIYTLSGLVVEYQLRKNSKKEV